MYIVRLANEIRPSNVFERKLAFEYFQIYSGKVSALLMLHIQLHHIKSLPEPKSTEKEIEHSLNA